MQIKSRAARLAVGDRVVGAVLRGRRHRLAVAPAPAAQQTAVTRMSAASAAVQFGRRRAAAKRFAQHRKP